MVNGPDSIKTEPSGIRDIALLPGETVSHVFSPELGLTQEAAIKGQLLIATNRRILAFRRNETFLAPLTELKAVALYARQRDLASVIHGAFLLIVGLLLYVAVAYWVTGRFHGPGVPWIDMDVVPLLILIVGLAGVVVGVRRYFINQEGTVTFQGSDWRFEFPYRGKRAGRELSQMVNSVFATRFSSNGHAYLWED